MNARPGWAHPTHTLLSQARRKGKMRGFNGEERQERKEVRLGSEGGTQVDRESRAEGRGLAHPLLWTRSHFIFCPYIVLGPLVPLLCDLRPTPHPLWPSLYLSPTLPASEA